MADSTLYDLSAFPEPQIIEEVSLETTVGLMTGDLVALFPDLVGVAGLESEPSQKNIQVVAFRKAILEARMNDVVKSNLLAFAVGTDLDNLAVFYDVIRMNDEGDDRLRKRVVLEIQGRSTGGTAPRYRAVAMKSSLRVQDVVVYREGTDPTIYVAVYSIDNNGVADEALLETVRTAVNDASVRMVNDTIIVKAAIFTVINISANVWLLPESPDSLIGTMPATLRSTWAAETGLGFDLARAWIGARLMRPGIQRVDVLTPVDNVVASPNEAIAIGTVTLNNMGRAY
ncbi:baseplate J/gp47 family protein [Microvirga brassicacearum]|uniref:Baseplate J protein n=1 Tax=Microvirga brassicacearum TaxID=2580413 RepID=A0A5N3PH50_9HYPH|nr:baseplate J/gp47 family protein [Microvirga brassicacearum]KAB0269066.1 baseplate J protein [Microvirga brassicacearum]